MEQLKTGPFIQETVEKAMQVIAQQENADLEFGEFTVVQQLADGQGVVVKFGFDGAGQREVQVSVSDSIFLLEPMEKTLDVYVPVEEGT